MVTTTGARLETVMLTEWSEAFLYASIGVSVVAVSLWTVWHVIDAQRGGGE